MASPCPCVRTLCLAHRKLLRYTALGKREVCLELVCDMSPCRDAKAQLVRHIDLKLRSLVFPHYFCGESSFHRRWSGWEHSNATTGFRKDHFIPRFASLISNQISLRSLPSSLLLSRVRDGRSWFNVRIREIWAPDYQIWHRWGDHEMKASDRRKLTEEAWSWGHWNNREPSWSPSWLHHNASWP